MSRTIEQGLESSSTWGDLGGTFGRSGNSSRTCTYLGLSDHSTKRVFVSPPFLKPHSRFGRDLSTGQALWPTPRVQGTVGVPQ